jgi:DNA-binding NarL/FixJ family response regulator
MLLSDLTPRQREVAELVGFGLTRPQIASRLGRNGSMSPSIRTIDAHVQAIAARLPKDDLTALRRVRKWVDAERNR